MARPRKVVESNGLEGRWLFISETRKTYDVGQLESDRDRLEGAGFRCCLIRTREGCKLYRMIDKRDLVQEDMGHQAYAEWIKHLENCAKNMHPRS